ncbi:hypothetical protein [Halorussus sp. MSC15.2]|uniref:hypothetical protein n=1 Tax=Halorussus sp. MSC15.2 TaxID=2283638 RepID=UPI0013D4AC15|nr:hypothetical protein [Halorussus sp. MSC15.2]NEU58619.1 hypothetical protein [Halorussus sp. MSC15.2]
MSTTDDVADSDEDVQHIESDARTAEQNSLRSGSDIEAAVADLADRVERLEAAVAQKDVRIDALEDELAAEREARETAIRDEQIQRTQIVQNAKTDLREEVSELRDSLVAEQKTRSRSDALIEKRVTHLEDELDAEVDDVTVSGDKLIRLVRCGPDNVVDRVYPVHERARALLIYATDWGSLVSDGNGRRLVFLAPDVRPYLEARFDRTFSTSEVERVFSKVADFAEDSPRRVRKDKCREGYHRLLVWKPDPLVSAAERMGN